MQDCPFCLITAQVVKGLIVGVQGSGERLDRQREDCLGQLQPVHGVQGDIGGQRGGARRAVDQGHALAFHQVAGVHGSHHMHEGKDLPRATLPVEGNARQRAVQQGGHTLGEFRPHLGVPADEVGQPGEDDTSDNTLIKAIPAEAPAHPPEAARILAQFLRRDRRADFHTWPGGHPVDEAARVRAQQALEPRAGLAHDPQSGRADDHTLTIYGDPPERLQREILPRADDNGHFPSWQARDRDGGADAAAPVLNQMRGGRHFPRSVIALQMLPQLLRLGQPAGPTRRYQRQQRGGLAVWVWGGTVVSTWVT